MKYRLAADISGVSSSDTMYLTCWAGHHADIRPWNVWGLPVSKSRSPQDPMNPGRLWQVADSAVIGRRV
jgi:hypothetical protein